MLRFLFAVAFVSFGFLLAGCTDGESVSPTASALPEVDASAAEARTDDRPNAETGDWPWWFGPTFDAKAVAADVPTTWSKTENIVWKADVPGRGHSTPIVVANRILLTTADESAKTQLIVGYDRESGAKLWTSVAHEGGFTKKHRKNSHASATPASDGAKVYASFINSGALWVTATDLEGKQAWQTKVGTFNAEHGYGASPVLYKDLIIVNGDSLGEAYIAAVRTDGEIAWKTDRPPSNVHGSYATPIVAHVARRPQLLLAGGSFISSYEPDSGKLIWRCDGPTLVMANTIVAADDLVFVSGGYPEKEILCIRADGTGDITNSHVVWRTEQGVTYVPSPVVHDGRLYMVNDGGFASCFDAKSGKEIWNGRLQGGFSASPTLAGGHFYIPNEKGKLFVFKAGDEFEIVAQNDLGDGGFASPVVCGNRIYLRTHHHLYCIGASVKTAAR